MRLLKKLLLIYLFVMFIMAGFFIPESRQIPVAGARPVDWNSKSFWYSPWGRSGVHKGIDIFAKAGTPVLAATQGLVVYTGVDRTGGNVVSILGAKWRVYYYAHLQNIHTGGFHWVRAGERIGTVGTTGNAQGKPPHLHFTIRSLFPLPGQYDPDQPQAWSKMFYINPDEFLRGSLSSRAINHE
jgi:murein DD-endopeptidase MepM/ murein hydrolase activator NlpD